MSAEQQQAVDKAVGDAVAALYPADVVVGYALVVEVLDGDEGSTGESGILCRVNGNATPWHTIGRLEYALEVERAAIVARRLEG